MKLQFTNKPCKFFGMQLAEHHMVDQLAYVYAVATHPANMAPRAEMTHSGELKPRMATAWWGSKPS